MKKKVRYIQFNDIKISPRFFEAALAEKDICIGFDDAVPSMAEYPWLFDEKGPVAPLHVAVYDFYMDGIRPRRPGEIVHHRDGDKMNATIENLGIGSRSVHGLAHAKKKQKFTPRKRWNLSGWFRPRAEEEVQSLGFLEELHYQKQLLARSAKEKARKEEIRRALETSRLKVVEECARKGRPFPVFMPEPPLDKELKNAEIALAGLLPALRRELDNLDSGEKIPPPESRPRMSDRLLDIRRTRRGCTPGEAALVRLLVKHRFSVENVAREAGLSERAVRAMMHEPAVDLAMEHWRDYRRLPPPCSPKRLKRYLHKRRDRAVGPGP